MESQGNDSSSSASKESDTFAFIISRRIFPTGVEPSLSAEQIDHIPDELENRLPDYCVNGNNAWLVDPDGMCRLHRE
jgi:hypothetical protein